MLCNSFILENGAETRIRTRDTRIFSPLLYRLSYLGMADEEVGASRSGPLEAGD